MKINEVVINDIEKIKNIKDILSMTDNQNLLSFVEKKLKNIQSNEAQMNNTQRIDAIVKSLQESNNPQLIDYIESILKKAELESRVEKLWSQRGFNSGRMIKYKDNFKNAIIQSPSSLKSKIELLFLLTSNKSAVTSQTFQKSFKSNLDNIIPSKILNNSTFAVIKNTIFFDDSFRGKGIGPGEFALSLIGRNSTIVDHKGDITIEGWGIEIKDGGGGSIKTGSPNSFRKADLMRDWIGKKLRIQLDRENKLKWDSENNFTVTLNSLDRNSKQEMISEYIKSLYPNLPEKAQQSLIQGIFKDAGTPVVRQHFGKALLSTYKEQDEWSSILFIKKDGTIANVVDPADADQYLDFSLAGINRDGDTQALPDGYVNGKIK
jgi:hypothetical protein